MSLRLAPSSPSPSTHHEVPMKLCLTTFSATQSRPSTQPRPSATEVSMNPCLSRCRSTRSATESPLKQPRRRFLTLKSLFVGLDRELDLLAPTYAALHTAHPALAPYATLPSLLERLLAGPRDHAKKALLAELVAIRQSDPHRLWVAILLRAFRPMLRNVWKKLFGSDRQERCALLLLAFQDAIGHVDPRRDPLRIAMYVRQATRRRVIVALTKELRWDEIGFGEDPDEIADDRVPDTPAVYGARATQRLLGRGALWAHVRRTHPTLTTKEQARLYHTARRGLRRLLGCDAVYPNEVTP
jgi:hypothetical protein